MTKSIRMIAALLCLIMLFTACGTNATDSSDSTSSNVESESTDTANVSTVKEFRLAYASMDTLDPYSSKSKQNKEISTLLYDSLFTVDSSYRLIYRIGKSIETYEKYCIVTLAENVYFTDGTLLTSADVVDSFKAAKASTTAGYRDDLTNFKNCTQLSDFVVTFEMSTASVNAAYALTFPIFKSGTRGQKLSNNINKPPVGSGRYIFTNVNGDTYLYANNSWSFGEIRTQTLRLCETIDSEAVSFCLANGKVNCAYDDLSDEALETANGSQTQVIPLNNIVFVGVNSKSKIIGNNNFRKFISAVLDRNRIATDYYLSRAVPATGLFNPQNAEVAEKMKISVNAASTRAEQLFAELGFDEKKDAEGYVTVDGVRPTLRIVVSKDSAFRTQTANYISAAVSTYGVACTVSVLESDAYLSALKNGEYDLYVGEMKVGADLSLNTLLNVYGAPNGDALASYKKYRAGSITVTEFIDTFEEELPIIPLVFRLGVVYLPENMQGDMNPSYSDVYFNIQNCYFS